MNRVSLLTIVPSNLATQLANNKRIENFNTLPQINDKILEVVRDFMTDNVGYSNLPMACFSKSLDENDSVGAESTVFNYLPVNRNESVLFQLNMPEDMIISVSFSELLSASVEAGDCLKLGDDEDLEFVKESFREKLSLGISGNECRDQIIFIPFLALDKCEFYAKFDEDFNTQALDLPGVKQMDIRQLSSFID